jgi:hypothetical protein
MTGRNAIAALIAAIMLSFVIAGQAPDASKGPPSERTLARPVPWVGPEALTTTEAFSRALHFAGAAGGVVRTIGCEPEPASRAVEFGGLPLREVLDSIVSADPSYRWETDNDAINLIPISGEPELLKLHINRFKAENVISAQVALDQLLALPEASNRMAELRLSRGLQLLVIPSAPNQPTFSVHCRNTTLRSTLNAIASAKGHAVWSYTERHCKGINEVGITF